MPDVRMPDGTIIKNVPEGMTRAELQRKYDIKSGRTGKNYSFDVPDGADEAAILASGKAALQQQEPETLEAPVMAQPSTLEAVGNVAQNALGQVTIGAGMLPDMASKAATGINNAFAGMVGAVAEPVLRGVGADGAANALGGYLDRSMSRPAPTIEGMVRRTNPEVNKPGNALANFGYQALGSMLWPIGPKGSPVARTAPPVARPASSRIVPFADEIVAAGKANKTRVTTSDIRPPVSKVEKAIQNLGENLPLVGTAGMRAGQQKERIAAATRLVEDFGGTGADDAVDAVSANLLKTRGKELTKWTDRKKAIIDGVQGIAPAPKVLAAIDGQIAELTARGTPTALKVAQELKALRPGFEGKTLKQLEAMRADELSDVFKGDGMATIKTVGEKSMRAIYEPLREDMGEFIAKHGGSQAKATWAKANERLSAMAGELKAGAFKRALNEVETTPEGAAKLIFSKTPSEVNRLVANLSEKGKGKARSAVLYKAADAASENGVISPEKFATALKAMRVSTRGLFTPADAARIQGMERLLKGTKRASEAAVTTNSGQQLVPAAMGAAAYSQPYIVIPAALLARAYESAPVRDLLLRLGRAKPGSPGYKISYDKLTAQFAKMAPVAANDVDGALALSPSRAAAQDERD